MRTSYRVNTKYLEVWGERGVRSTWGGVNTEHLGFDESREPLMGAHEIPAMGRAWSTWNGVNTEYLKRGEHGVPRMG